MQSPYSKLIFVEIKEEQAEFKLHQQVYNHFLKKGTVIKVNPGVENVDLGNEVCFNLTDVLKYSVFSWSHRCVCLISEENLTVVPNKTTDHLKDLVYVEKIDSDDIPDPLKDRLRKGRIVAVDEAVTNFKEGDFVFFDEGRAILGGKHESFFIFRDRNLYDTQTSQ